MDTSITVTIPHSTRCAGLAKKKKSNTHTLLHGEKTIIMVCPITPLPLWIYLPSEKEYMTFSKAKTIATQNLIGRKIVWNVKHAHTYDWVPMIVFVTVNWIGQKHFKCHMCTSQTTCHIEVLQMNPTSNIRCWLYVFWEPPNFPMEYKHEAEVVNWESRMKGVILLGDGYQWPLPWECKLQWLQIY